MVALLPSFQALALFCSLAFAAPASHLATRDAHPHTHHVRSLPNGLVMRTYNPRSTFETYNTGIEHPLSKRAEPASFREAGMAFLTEKLGNDTVWRSTFKKSSAATVYAFQQINGIPVVNSVASASFNSAGKVTSFSHNFASADKVADSKPKITVDAAVASALKSLSGVSTGKETSLKYYATDDGSLALTHSVEMKLKGNDHTVRAFVNAQNGNIEGMFDFTNNLQFRVSPINSQDPSKDFELLTDPEDLEASPQGWNNFQGQETGQLLGNNAVSFIDDPNTGVGSESSTGVFDFNLNVNQDPTLAVNQNASRTNAFFVVNTVHDIAYRYGFTEEAFNFQQDNFGKGGVGGDLVLISVQDSSGTDNAQFTTQEDGQQGVMQMFIFKSTDPTKDGAVVNAVVAHEMTHGISNRLTGGGTGTCLQTLESGGLGEGWSDAFAEWTEQTSGQIEDYAVGSFLFPPNGIRTHPYSLDRSINPLKFSDVAQLNEVHDIGEVWAQTLHVVHAALVEANGFSKDANTNPEGTGGNVIWMHLFIDQLALQPCNPTFLDARASWIQADVNRFNGANACTLWTAFASMGLGPDAADGVDDNDVPVSCGGNGSETASTGSGNSGTAGTGTGNGNTTTTGNNGGNGRGRGRGGRRGGRNRNAGFRGSKNNSKRMHKH